MLNESYQSHLRKMLRRPQVKHKIPAPSPMDFPRAARRGASPFQPDDENDAPAR